MRIPFAVPLVAVASVATLLFADLHRGAVLAASPAKGKPLPEFVLPEVRNPGSEFRSEELVGEPALLNVWASWCPPCLAELPLLISVTDEVRILRAQLQGQARGRGEMARTKRQCVHQERSRSGRRSRSEVRHLRRAGDFVIDRNGRIVHRHIGPISVREWAHVFRPLVQRRQSEPD